MSTTIVTGEEMVLAAKQDWTDRALHGIGVEFDAAVVEEAGESWPTDNRVADCFSEARSGIGSWIDYFNCRWPHSSFDGRTPDEVYATAEMTEQLAA